MLGTCYHPRGKAALVSQTRIRVFYNSGDGGGDDYATGVDSTRHPVSRCLWRLLILKYTIFNITSVTLIAKSLTLPPTRLELKHIIITTLHPIGVTLSYPLKFVEIILQCLS